MAKYSTRWLIEAVTDNKDAFQNLLDTLANYGVYISDPESMTISAGDIEEIKEEEGRGCYDIIQDSEERIHRRLDRIESMLTNIARERH